MLVDIAGELIELNDEAVTLIAEDIRRLRNPPDSWREIADPGDGERCTAEPTALLDSRSAVRRGEHSLNRRLKLSDRPADGRRMNFAFFEALTDVQAERCLGDFLREGQELLPGLVAEAASDGVAADLSLGSVPSVIGAVARRTTTQALDPDPALPSWIHESETYAQNLFDFSVESKPWLTVAAFYLGEAFVRAYPNLDWAVGTPRTAVQGQPVVTGFAHTLELAPLLVTENVIARGVHDAGSEREAQRMIATWRSHVAS